MIQSAFKSAYTNEVAAQNQGINTITGGVKAVGAAVALGVGAATGAGSAVVKYIGKVTGIGGFMMNNKIEEKKESAEGQKLFSEEEIQKTISSNLGDNPINRAAIKKLSTVFEKLTEAKESGIINKEGKIKSELGDIDPNSELGKRVLEGMNNDNDR